MNAPAQHASPVKTERNISEAAKLRQRALARWDNEGGAGPDGPQRHDLSDNITAKLAGADDLELEQLHARIIAVESLLIALLAEGSAGQRDLARNMAATISPRPGSTQHPLTIHAARQMLAMIERAEHFRMTTSGTSISGEGASNEQN